MRTYGLRTPLIGCLFAMCLVIGSAPGSQAFLLVSPEEAARERAKGGRQGTLSFRGAGKAGLPEIVLVNPASLTDIPSPIDIELKFLPKAPSKIVRDSLRVLYGFFGFDITDRLTEHAEVTPLGIVARNAELPSGSHSITIEISDNQNRTARKTYRFEIKK